MEPIILASSSPRRRELLTQAGIPFIVMPGDVDEENAELYGTPGQKAEQLALMKARNVAEKLTSGLVLGADTIVVCDDELFGKPQDVEDARRMLSRMNGREHQVITGTALLDVKRGKARVDHVSTRVRFATLTEAEISAYIQTGEPFGKAGAYAVQGKGALLVERMDGCYSNVVGLPLQKLHQLMKAFDIQVMDKNWQED